MSQLTMNIKAPPEGGTFVMLSLMDIDEHYAPRVEVAVRQNMHCHEVGYNGNLLQFTGQMFFEDPEDPEVEHFILGQCIWDALDQHYCETMLILNPREPNQRIFCLESDGYEAYLKDTMSERLRERRKELREVKKDERD